MQFVRDRAGEMGGGVGGEGRGGSGIRFTLFKECSVTHMSVCPGAYSMEWKGWDGRVLALSLSLSLALCLAFSLCPFFFLLLFPLYFAGLTSLSPHSGAERKLNAVLSIALNRVAI